MTKLICPTSGLEWSISQPTIYGGLQVACEYPLFSLDYPALSRLAKLWEYRKLSELESAMLSIALFKSSGLARFEAPLLYTSLSKSAVANGIPMLVQVLELIHDAGNHEDVSSKFPSLVITKELGQDKQFSYLPWCEACLRAAENYYQSLATRRKIEREELKRDALKRALNNKGKNPTRWVKYLADWVADAAEFPTSLILVDDKRVSIKDYWQYCIRCCGTRDRDYRYMSINQADLVELQDHLFERLPLTTSYAFEVMSIISATLADMSFFSGASFSSLTSDLEPIPESELLTAPTRAAYPDLKLYMLAMSEYNIQQARIMRSKQEPRQIKSALDSVLSNTRIKL